MCFRRLDGADQYRWQRFVERLAIVAFVGEKAALLETPQCAIEILGRDRIGDVRIDPMATGRGLVAELARGHYRTAAGAAAFRQDVKIDPRPARHSMRTPSLPPSSGVLPGSHKDRHRIGVGM